MFDGNGCCARFCWSGQSFATECKSDARLNEAWAGKDHKTCLRDEKQTSCSRMKSCLVDCLNLASASWPCTCSTSPSTAVASWWHFSSWAVRRGLVRWNCWPGPWPMGKGTLRGRSTGWDGLWSIVDLGSSALEQGSLWRLLSPICEWLLNSLCEAHTLWHTQSKRCVCPKDLVLQFVRAGKFATTSLVGTQFPWEKNEDK